MSSPEVKRNIETLGIAYMSLEAGGFYQGLTPGGFQDVASRIVIPGPKVEFVDEHSKEIKAFKEIPEPVQIPHLKMVNEKNEHSGLYEDKEYSFTSLHKSICDGLLYALQTGVIKFVPDDEMQEKYPDTWAKREAKIIWRDASNKPAKSARQLLDEAEQSDDYARNARAVSAHVKATQAALLGGKTPPPPLVPSK